MKRHSSAASDKLGGERGRVSSVPSLRRNIGVFGLFALSFGSLVGSGWVVVLGEWLVAAGPGGAALGFLCGGLAMLTIGACYAELTARMPRVGGEFTYINETLGRTPAFLVGWFLSLNYIAFAAFEGIALTLLLRTLVPGVAGPIIYEWAGEPVTVGSLVFGLGGTILFGLLNAFASKSSQHFQNVVTFGFIAVVMALIAMGAIFGDVRNLRPMFSPISETSLSGTIWIFSTTILFLNGFQAAAHAIEERAEHVSVKAVGHVMLAAIASAVVFYVLIILTTSAAAPWRESALAAVPAAHAFGSLIPGVPWLGTLIVATAAISLLKTWNAIVIVGSRLILAQARQGVLPGRLARIGQSGTPLAALLAFTVGSSLGVLMGPGGLVPILNTCAVCVALSFSLIIVALLRHRRLQPAPAEFVVPGGRITVTIALVAAIGMGGAAAFEPYFRAGGDIPLEWLLLVGWAALGLVLNRLSRRRGQRGQAAA